MHAWMSAAERLLYLHVCTYAFIRIALVSKRAAVGIFRVVVSLLKLHAGSGVYPSIHPSVKRQ